MSHNEFRMILSEYQLYGKSSCSTCEIFSAVYQQLNKAIESQDIKTINLLLSRHRYAGITLRGDIQALMHRAFWTFIDDHKQHQDFIIEVLRLFLKNGTDVNSKNYEGKTVVHLAIEYRMTEVINFLISQKLKLNEEFGSILHILIESEFKTFKTFEAHDSLEIALKQSTDFISWMLNKGLSVDRKNKNGETPLHFAAKFNLLHALPILLEHTYDVTIINACGKTAFQVFLESVVSAINRNVYDGIPLKNYQSDYAEKVCADFLNTGYSINVVDENKNTPLHYTLKQKARSLAKLILNYVENVDARDDQGNTALKILLNYQKSDKDDEELVRILLSKGADVHKSNESGSSPLTTAVSKQKMSMLKIFAEFGTDISPFCNSNNTDMKIDNAVMQKPNVNAKNKDGTTPLHLAAQHDDVTNVKRLLANGANINSKESFRNYSPLHTALLCNQNDIVKLLLNHGADVNAKTVKNQTPLHFVSNATKDAVKILIRKGADINVKDIHGFLPIHTAIINKEHHVVRELIRFGADVNDDTDVFNENLKNTVSRCLGEHLTKLRAAELHFDGALEAYFTYSTNGDARKLRKKCQKEIEKMKNYKVTNTMSLYDFLHIQGNATCKYIRNEKLKELIGSPMFEQKFPFYYEIISSVYYQAIERSKILESAKDGWLELTNIRLPDICVYEIINNLSNVTLRVLIDGANMNNGNR